MNVTQVSARDSDAGAALAASLLHDALREIGVDSRMLVGLKRRHEPEVRQFQPPGGAVRRAVRAVRRRMSDRSIERLLARADSISDGFHAEQAYKGLGLERELADTDLVNLHWVSGFVDYRTFFARLPESIPIVWSLHDMNSYTGGCHFDNGCGRFADACGRCPILGSTEQSDLSAAVLRRKIEALKGLTNDRLHIVSTSSWMRDRVNESALFGRFAHRFIPYGVDTEIYTPRDKAAARDALGIPTDAVVVFFVSENVNNPRKGLRDVMEALAGLPESSKLFLLSIGHGQPPGQDKFPNRHLAPVWNRRLMSVVYSAADLYAMGAHQDNLPHAILEAMGCGLPVVSYDAGGISDVVKNDETGFLVPRGRTDELGAAILETARDEKLRSRLGENSRLLIREKHTIQRLSRDYRDLYAEILGGRGE